MQAAILCLGKMKEGFYRRAADEYLKRLSRFGKVEEIELSDLPEPENTSPATEKQIMEKEGVKLLEKIRSQDYVLAMCIGGKQYDSLSFAQHVKEVTDRGEKRLVFVIGGSLGLGGNVLNRANEKISLSNLTFPHQLARVVLLEQLYRAEKIIAGERYHK